jgi:MFS family permease
VFYSIGFSGMIFCVDVITADTSSLRDRGLAYAFTSSPYIITAYAGSAASQHFYETNWRWGFGTFAIVLPIVALPLFVVLQYNKRKAKKAGLLVEVRSDRTILQSLWYYTIQFDGEFQTRRISTNESVLGVVLVAGGLALFLLPFAIASSAADSWRSPHIIAMLVIGFTMLVSFALVQKYISPVPFVPWELLTNRTVLATCIISFVYQIAYYCWASYFSSYLQVVFGTSIATAGYITSIFDVVSGVWLLGVGYLIRKTGYFRWLLWIAIPLYILGSGLMIYFRRPGGNLGYNIMCQIFLAFAGGTMIICQQVSVLSVSSHNNAAAVLALLGLFGNTGGAVGNSISGAVWTHTFPKALQKYLPEESVGDWELIYEDLEMQLSFPIGDATRIGIMESYAVAQRAMLIAGTSVMVLALGMMFVVRNVKVKGNDQVKGVLF